MRACEDYDPDNFLTCSGRVYFELTCNLCVQANTIRGTATLSLCMHGWPDEDGSTDTEAQAGRAAATQRFQEACLYYIQGALHW